VGYDERAHCERSRLANGLEAQCVLPLGTTTEEERRPDPDRMLRFVCRCSFTVHVRPQPFTSGTRSDSDRIVSANR
jgi:hypothetical protein